MAGIDIQFVTGPGEVERLRSFWTQVNRHPDVDIEFFGLINSVRDNIIKPYIVVATDEAQLKAILVGRLEDTFLALQIGYATIARVKLRQLTFLQEGLLGECTPEIVEAMVRGIVSLLKRGVADRAFFCNVDTGSELYRLAKKVPNLLVRDHSNRVSDRWVTKLPPQMEEFLKRRSRGGEAAFSSHCTRL